MNNKAAISHAVRLARRSNWLSISYARFGMAAAAQRWLDRRTTHMATARQLKQDAQQ